MASKFRTFSRKATVLSGPAAEGQPVVEHLEEAAYGGDPVSSELALDRISRCGCGKAVREAAEIGGVCVMGEVICQDCAGAACSHCGLRACRAHRTDQPVLCAVCARTRLFLALAAVALALVALGSAGYLLHAVL